MWQHATTAPPPAPPPPPASNAYARSRCITTQSQLCHCGRIRRAARSASKSLAEAHAMLPLGENGARPPTEQVHLEGMARYQLLNRIGEGSFGKVRTDASTTVSHVMYRPVRSDIHARWSMM